MDIEKEKNPEDIPETIRGVVTARKCDCCGHHEVGVTLDSGEYLPLRPGMRVMVISR